MRQCVHNNLPSSFRYPISVGSVPVSLLFDRYSSSLKWKSHKTCKWWAVLVTSHSLYSNIIFITKVYKQSYRMQNSLKSWDNIYTITYKGTPFPFQWEVYPLVCYWTVPGTLWNEKVTKIASGEIF